MGNKAAKISVVLKITVILRKNESITNKYNFSGPGPSCILRNAKMNRMSLSEAGTRDLGFITTTLRPTKF